MSAKVIMPKLGVTMTEGTITKWHKAEGDKVKKGESLLEIESDKTSFTIESPEDGILLKRLAAENTAVPCAEIIAVIGALGEEVPPELSRKNAENISNTNVTDRKTSENQDDKTTYDIGIIGGGPGGYVAAIKAAQEGAKVVLFEKDELGGTCLNRGCIPTKTFLKTAKELKKIKKLNQLGIEGFDNETPTVNMPKLQSRKNKIVKQLTSGVSQLLKANGVFVVKGKALMDKVGEIRINSNVYKVKNAIIATGSVPKRIPIPGIDSPNVITSDEALLLDEIPREMVILGGGVIGIEFALAFNALGSKVTIVEMLDRILPTIDEEIGDTSRALIETEGIAIHTSARAKEIEGNTLVYEKGGEQFKISGDKILVAVGREPNLNGINIEKLGIKTDKGAIITDEYLKTNVASIYAIGDVNGKYMLAHKASAEGITAIDNILGNTVAMDYTKIPQCVYSFPEIASVGLSEQEAKKKYGGIKVGKFLFSANGKALVEGEQEGFIKVIADEKYNGVLGIHILGPSATDMISEAALALELECTTEELCRVIHPHPTLSESMMEAFHAATKKAIHSL